jgi:hypothetical protein
VASRGKGANARGANWERAAMHWMNDQWGLGVERIRSGRSTDAGDLTWPGSRWLVDAKSQGRWNVHPWMVEAEREADAEGVLPALLLDRPGTTDAGRALVVVRLRDASDLFA